MKKENKKLKGKDKKNNVSNRRSDKLKISNFTLNLGASRSLVYKDKNNDKNNDRDNLVNPEKDLTVSIKSARKRDHDKDLDKESTKIVSPGEARTVIVVRNPRTENSANIIVIVSSETETETIKIEVTRKETTETRTTRKNLGKINLDLEKKTTLKIIDFHLI